MSAQIAFYEFCRNHRLGEEAVPLPIREAAERALALYKVTSFEPSEELREALWRLAVAHAHPDARHRICSSILRGMITLNQANVQFESVEGLPATLERVARLARQNHRAVSDSARQASYELFQRHRFLHRDQKLVTVVERLLSELKELDRSGEDAQERVMNLLNARQSLMKHLAAHTNPTSPLAPLAVEVLVKRFYQKIDAVPASQLSVNGVLVLEMDAGDVSQLDQVVCVSTDRDHLDAGLEQLANYLDGRSGTAAGEVILSESVDEEAFAQELQKAVAQSRLVSLPGLRVTFTWNNKEGNTCHLTYRQSGTGLDEMSLLRNIHPEAAQRIELWRLSEFEVERLASHEQVFVFRGRAKENPQDERLFVFAEVRDVPNLDGSTTLSSDEHLLEFEQAYFEGIRVIQEEQAKRDKRKRYHWNRMAFYLRPVFEGNESDMVRISRRLEAPTTWVGSPESGGARQSGCGGT